MFRLIGGRHLRDAADVRKRKYRLNRHWRSRGTYADTLARAGVQRLGIALENHGCPLAVRERRQEAPAISNEVGNGVQPTEAAGGCQGNVAKRLSVPTYTTESDCLGTVGVSDRVAVQRSVYLR